VTATYAVIVRWIARPGEEAAVERCLRALTGPSRAEPGNLEYQPHRDAADPRVFHIYERYVDEAAALAHLETPHVLELGFGDAIPRLEDRQRVPCVPIEPRSPEA
jgi:quinol monooxygenase YgiN